ncbi:hypothetical protein ADK67_20100 [Saccharothrix sp. NRRL B-16348]|uniref:hypothetical protein n=1 Tax=Saccharothrix sp. NRRL B-16348 TaxID=1415542 RepID=UPI0006ADEFEC|nr:hypothetical protein [Saccharothrix sp. NRRL B-16348]KOX23684.1 hypothetical protein ADK67_20100 [Saccharothrix sp. NRRL B-16348]
MRSNRVAAAGFAVVVSVVLSACADDPSSTMRTFDTPQALAEANRVAAEGKGSVTVDLDLATNGKGSCGLRTDDFAASCRISIADAEEVAYVMVPDGIFVRIPQGQAPQPDKPWLRIDPDDPDNALARAMADVAVHIRDTADIRKALPEGARIVEKAEESLSGKQTVRYTAHVTVDGRASVLKLWVDDQDLPVKTEARTPVEGGEAVRVVAHYRDWGKPVDITPPTPEQLSELPALPG